MNNWDILSLRATPDWKLILEISLPILAIAVIFLGLLIWRRSGPRPFAHWETIELEIPFAGVGKIKIKPNHEVVRIAHKAWVELATRKAGLIFDRDHDLISEVYNSWYQLFGEMRQLAKQVPAERIRADENTRTAVGLIIDALNDGLRPHLTRWQARFRAWYEREKSNYSDKDPQEIQRLYPHYDELVADLERINTQIMQYMNELKKLVA